MVAAPGAQPAPASAPDRILEVKEVLSSRALDGTTLRVIGYVSYLSLCTAKDPRACTVRTDTLLLADEPVVDQKTDDLEAWNRLVLDRIVVRNVPMDLRTGRPFAVGQRYVLEGSVHRGYYRNSPVFLVLGSVEKAPWGETR